MTLFEVILVTIPIKILNLVIAVIPAYFLWNWLIPDIFSLPKIGFFQTLGLIILVQCVTSRGYISLDTNK